MTFNTVFSSGILSLIVWLLFTQHAFALPERVPPDVFEAHPNGYVYADYPGVFDDAEGDGITIEAWIYLTERPRDSDSDFYANWLIVAKPASYFLAFKGRTRNSSEMESPRGTTRMTFGLQIPRQNGMAGSIAALRIPREEFPLRRWVHVGFQIAPEKSGIPNAFFYDRTILGGYGNERGRTGAPLLIGGLRRIVIKGFEWGHKFKSMEGYIDEVHVSKGFRYAADIGGDRIRPRRHFRADARTIALWRFEEGRGAHIYRDSSDNGYHLFPGGSLTVDSRGKLATTWGSLKRRAQDAE